MHKDTLNRVNARIGGQGNYSVGHSISSECKRALCECVCLSVRAIVETQYLLQMNVLVDNSLVPFWILCLLGIPGPSLAISTIKQEDVELLS